MELLGKAMRKTVPFYIADNQLHFHRGYLSIMPNVVWSRGLNEKQLVDPPLSWEQSDRRDKRDCMGWVWTNLFFAMLLGAWAFKWSNSRAMVMTAYLSVMNKGTGNSPFICEPRQSSHGKDKLCAFIEHDATMLFTLQLVLVISFQKDFKLFSATPNKPRMDSNRNILLGSSGLFFPL